VTTDRDLTLTHEELYQRLTWSVRLRWFASIATNIALVVAWFQFNVRFPLPATTFVALGVPLYNAIFALFVANLYAREAITARVIEAVANAQVAADIIAVAALVHLTGGIENPFIVFIIFPIVYALPLLRRRMVLCHATLAALLVNLICWGEYAGILSHVHLPTVGAPILYRSPLYVFQTSFALTVTLYLLLLIGGSVASTLRRKERELEAAYRQLRELHEARAFYVRKVNHELRAPLAAMRSLLQVILQGLMGTTTPQQHNALTRIDRRAEGLLGLVADLLMFARLETEDKPQRRERVPMDELVGNNAMLLMQEANEKNLTLQVSVVPATIEGNREDLRQLVTNLVSNAIRYTPPGGTVWIIGVIHGRSLVLQVRDTGIGIPKDKLSHVFDEFFRAPNARQMVPEGTGMGLAISRRIAELHGGRLEVESIEGEGSTFTATLPLAESPKDTAE
jgi:signal transduction histidine kinase